MERNYNVGLDSNSISLQVNVGTTATAYTNAYQRIGGGQKIIKAESSVTSNGRIPQTPIGTASDLKATKLMIQTTVDFRALPQEIIDAIKSDPQAFKTNLVIEYILNGGFSGLQKYDYDYDDYVMGSTQAFAVVTKEIIFQP